MAEHHQLTTDELQQLQNLATIDSAGSPHIQPIPEALQARIDQAKAEADCMVHPLKIECCCCRPIAQIHIAFDTPVGANEADTNNNINAAMMPLILGPWWIKSHSQSPAGATVKHSVVLELLP